MGFPPLRFVGLIATVSVLVGIQVQNSSAATTASTVRTPAAAIHKCTRYTGSITITKGGTYTGCWQSANPKTPAVKISTTAPVTIVNSGIQSKGDGIASDSHAQLTVRHSSINILNPGAAGVVKARWINVSNFTSITAENNDLTNGRGIFMSNWAGGSNKPVTVRFNRIRNVDGRTSNGSGYDKSWDVSSGFGVAVQLAESQHIPNVDISWNEVVNTPGQSAVEDNFSLWMSQGMPTSRIHVHDNFVQGSWTPDPANDPDSTGTAVNSGDTDGGGTHGNDEVGYDLIENNVGTGIANTCFGLSSGHDITVQGNRCVVSGSADWNAGPGTDIRPIAQADTGVGISGPWNEHKASGFKNNVSRNNGAAYYNRSKGEHNDMWQPDCDPGACTGNFVIKSGVITYQDEINEHNRWLNRVSSAHIRIGR